MIQQNNASPLLESRKKEIFQALVASQDQGASVAQSRVQMAEQFKVSESLVKSIEREGIDNNWPPLS